jgi:hypothetical protein
MRFPRSVDQSSDIYSISARDDSQRNWSHVPILAIMGYPQNKGPNFHAETPGNIAAATAADANRARQIEAFERGQPAAHVVRIADANHYIFISNETQVLGGDGQILGHALMNERVFGRMLQKKIGTKVQPAFGIRLCSFLSWR